MKAIHDIYSKQISDTVLHRTVMISDVKAETERVDVSDPNWNLQVSLLNWNVGKSVDRHVHLNKSRVSFSSTAQEAWVVLRGAFEVNYYDVDCEEVLHHCVATSGFISMSFAGLHSIEAIHENSVFLEIKSGPYVGKDIQKFRGL